MRPYISVGITSQCSRACTFTAIGTLTCDRADENGFSAPESIYEPKVSCDRVARRECSPNRGASFRYPLLSATIVAVGRRVTRRLGAAVVTTGFGGFSSLNEPT